MDKITEPKPGPESGSKTGPKTGPKTGSKSGPKHAGDKIRVGLFATCLVDLFRPSIGFACLKLLEEAGCEVSVPQGQTCCGQPAYNSGDFAAARSVARSLPDLFAEVDYIVVPSGSCAGMLRHHLASLFGDQPEIAHKARHLAARTYELTEFLVDILGQTVSARFRGRAAYHDSCAGLRELGIKSQPRQLLAGIDGLTLTKLEESETCCGFGGTFCVKYPEISNAMVTNKQRCAEQSGADVIIAGDLGCLLNMAGKASRSGSALSFRHIAEILAGAEDVPAIGAKSSRNKAPNKAPNKARRAD